MVSTSNWPPLVAMSVVTRWRRTFSSSVTHFTVTSGFLAVNSLVSACMRIMSPLLTVAIVSVVCAMEGAEPNRVAAPSRALRTCFTVTSLFGFEHMPMPYNYVHTDCVPCQGSESGFCTELGITDGSVGAACADRPPTGDLPARLERLVVSLRIEDSSCSRLVGDQPVDQTSLQRGSDRRHLGWPKGRPNGQRLGRNPRRNAGKAAICAAVDN